MVELFLILIVLNTIISVNYYEKYRTQREISIQRLMEKKDLEKEIEYFTQALSHLNYTDNRAQDRILYSINNNSKEDLSDGIQKIRITREGVWQIFKVTTEGTQEIANSKSDHIKIWSDGKRIK